jgi:hypothetical protein
VAAGSLPLSERSSLVGVLLPLFDDTAAFFSLSSLFRGVIGDSFLRGVVGVVAFSAPTKKRINLHMDIYIKIET